MNAFQNQRYEDLPFKEKAKIIQAVAFYPALTLMVFTRRRIGFRNLPPFGLLVMSTLVLIAAAATRDAAGPVKALLPVYAAAILLMGFFQRHQRWQEICRGVAWHTYSSGISCFEALPWPPWFHTQRRIYRVVEPSGCLLVGLLVGWLLSHALGGWIILSSLALFLFEQGAYETMLERDLDTLDGLIASEMQAETVKFFQQPQQAQVHRSLEDTAGIPTGVAPDIRHQVELRRVRQAKAPDNLAP